MPGMSLRVWSLPHGCNRLPVFVSLERSQLDGFRGIKQFGKPGLARLGHTPRPGRFAADAVAEAGLLLDHEHTQPASRQHPAQGRPGNAATDDDDIEDWRTH